MIRKFIFLAILILGVAYWFKDTVFEIDGNSFPLSRLYWEMLPSGWSETLKNVDVNDLKKIKEYLPDLGKTFESSPKQ
jgi:hypothetical protein